MIVILIASSIDLVRREARAAALVAAIASATGHEASALRRIHQKVQRNQMALKARMHSKEEVKEADVGVGLFPLVALLNHSCDANARFDAVRPVGGSLSTDAELEQAAVPKHSGLWMAVRAVRTIAQGEEARWCDRGHGGSSRCSVRGARWHSGAYR